MRNSKTGSVIVAILFQLFTATAFGDYVIEDFEPPNQISRVVSYPGEDMQTSSWRFDSSHGAGGTTNSFYLYGNTWKKYNVSDLSVYIDRETVWEIYVYAPSSGSIQSFGLTDGLHELRYIFEAMESPPEDPPWLLEYTGWKTLTSGFVRFKLPVGADWELQHGLETQIQVMHLLFINDCDASNGQAYFDQVKDITDAEPQTPIVDIGTDGEANVGELIQFEADIEDPDSSSFSYFWDFGDGTTVSTAAPLHSFSQPGRYNVLCKIKDPTGNIAMDSRRITVGSPENFVYTLLFGGDLMLGRRYEDANEDGIPGNSDGSLILPGDGGSGAKNIGHHTRRFYSDLRIINLETPLTDEGSPHPTKSISYRSRPDAIAGLCENGVGLVSIANNHLIDYMTSGLQETLQVLSNPTGYSFHARPGLIPYAGGGLNAAETLLPATKAFNGHRIGFLGFCSVLGYSANEQPFFLAGYEKPGVAGLDSANLQKAIPNCESLCDKTVVMLHSGYEYEITPSSETIDLAHEAIDLGADLVICHHPHVSQGVEFYSGVPIVYSLGNFFFDQKYQSTMSSFVVEVKGDLEAVRQIRINPVYVENYEPKFVQGDSGSRLTNRLLGLSAPLGSNIVAYPDLHRGCVVQPGLIIPTTETDQSFLLPTTLGSLTGAYISQPAVLESDQSLYGIDSITGVSGNKAVLAGHDIFSFGDFEEDDLDDDSMEGTGWDVPVSSSSAMISDTNPHEGSYCLRLRRQQSQTSPIEVESSWRMETESSKIYTLTGWYRLVDAVDAQVSLKFYYYAYTYESGWDEEIVVLGPVSGNRDWTYFAIPVTSPASLNYASIILHLESPSSASYGYAYFDEIRLISWSETWNPTLPVTYTNPTDVRYVALRTSSAQSQGRINTVLREDASLDSDGDGIPDWLEDCNQNGFLEYGETDPQSDDTDMDGLSDFEEAVFGEDESVTAGWRIDSDGDGYDDYQEYEQDTDPNDNLSHPVGPTATPTYTPYFSPTPIPPSATQSFTSTSTPSAFPTETPSPPSTQTFTPAFSASPTATPINTNLPSITPTFTTTSAPSSTTTPASTSTSIATQTPNPASGTPSPTAQATSTPPTPGPNWIETELVLSDVMMTSGERSWAKIRIMNQQAAIFFDLYVILDVFGDYFFYPSWRSMDEGLDRLSIQAPQGYDETIFVLAEFTMPDIPFTGPLHFFAAAFHHENLSLEGLCSNVSFAEFSIGG